MPQGRPKKAQPMKKAQPAPGAPGAGAGGGKGPGATAAPPKPKPLQQMSAQQRQGMTQAAQKGNLDVFLAQHPGLKARAGKVAGGAGTPQQQAKMQGWQAANTAAKAAGQPPAGAPSTGASGAKPTAPAAPTTPAAAPAAAPANPSFVDALNTALGSGASDLLGPPAWTGPNPIETARAAAQRGLDENLANVRARYAGSGFGNSARESLAEGQAVGDFATQFGDVAAQRGMQQQQTGLDRLAQMYTTAGAQDLQGRALGLQSDTALANLGTGITAIGAQEQEIPNLSNAIALLTNMSGQTNMSRGAMHPPKG
jgi:hypothetical protein